MHILFLTDNFPPEVNAPATRTYEHCREWVRDGHEVTVVTCAPNFPSGRVFWGYRNRLWQTESTDGIRVVRVWTYVTANSGFVLRTLDYVSFMISAVVAGAFVRRPDLIVGTSPQFFTVCGAYLASRMRGVPFVFELRDLWPESIRAVGAMSNSWTLALLEHIELFLYRRSAAVVAVTNSFRKNLVARGIDSEKIFVVPNGVDVERFRPSARDERLVAELGLKDMFVVGYIGTLGMAHGLEVLLEAARRLHDAPDGRNVRLLVLGDGAEKARLVQRAREAGLDNVVFVDSVPREEVVRYWSLLDAAVIHLRKREIFRAVIPSKLFECMAMGIPVIHGVAGESADIVREADCGETFEPENAEELCDRLLRLRDSPDLRRTYRDAALRAAEGHDRRARAAEMLEVLHRIVSSSDSAKAHTKAEPLE